MAIINKVTMVLALWVSFWHIMMMTSIASYTMMMHAISLSVFEELATSLGTILNTEKTRILTSTSGKSLVLDKLISSPNFNSFMKGTLLQSTISNYSTATVLVEVTDGLRVLGTPIGSLSFCESFISTILQKANEDADKLLSSGLDKMYKQWLDSLAFAQSITLLTFSAPMYSIALFNTSQTNFTYGKVTSPIHFLV
jgi:hypothetical protein